MTCPLSKRAERKRLSDTTFGKKKVGPEWQGLKELRTVVWGSGKVGWLPGFPNPAEIAWLFLKSLPFRSDPFRQLELENSKTLIISREIRPTPPILIGGRRGLAVLEKT